MTEPMTPTAITTPRTRVPLTAAEPAWGAVTAYPLSLNQAEIAEGETLRESGEACFAFDDQAVYMLARFNDRDLATFATDDEDRIYRSGDVAEWFIGTPPSDDGEPGVYLEMHVAPNGQCRAYRIERPGINERLDPTPFEADILIDGSLNRRSDTDRAWAVQFTLPWQVLETLDPRVTDPVALRHSLSTLVGRFNYGRQLGYRKDGTAGPELSMWPPQPRPHFHLRPFHAPIRFED